MIPWNSAVLLHKLFHHQIPPIQFYHQILPRHCKRGLFSTMRRPCLPELPLRFWVCRGIPRVVRLLPWSPPERFPADATKRRPRSALVVAATREWYRDEFNECGEEKIKKRKETNVVSVWLSDGISIGTLTHWNGKRRLLWNKVV